MAEPEMGAGRIDAHEIVVAIKRLPAVGAAGGVAGGRGNAPGDAFGWVQGPPSGGDFREGLARFLLEWCPGIPRARVFPHGLAVAGTHIH